VPPSSALIVKIMPNPAAPEAVSDEKEFAAVKASLGEQLPAVLPIGSSLSGLW